ncbi:MAG TPA: sensor histidine kinase [Solirubrobacteraceae bacterium]|nr:sensor histidine kinase [Solirubrobacteraceae bacterium]
MAEQRDNTLIWIGRLVRVVIVFRALVLLATVLLLPSDQRTPVTGVAMIAAAIVSYVPLRHWDKVAPSLLRHPAYLAGEIMLSTLILGATGARSSFFYFTVGTAALAGIIYGRRGAIPFCLLLVSMYELVALEGMHTVHNAQTVVFLPLLYPAGVIAGIAARELVLRGAEVEAMLAFRNGEIAVQNERLRVAREMHDSLAKTVEGLSMMASALPARCERDPMSAAALARQLSADARQAAVEARALMTDLRPTADQSLPLAELIGKRVDEFAQRSGVTARFVDPDGSTGADGPPPEAHHEILRILGEALMNAERHGHARNVTVTLRDDRGAWSLSIADDGSGLREAPDLKRLQAGGHFGIAGMHERARSIGGVLEVAPNPAGGTIVVVRVPSTDHPATQGRPRRTALPLRFGRWRAVRGRAGELGGQQS